MHSEPLHFVLLHGYLLQGTGSNIYVVNVALAARALGHRVTVVCQDLDAASLPFVDEMIGPGAAIPTTPPDPGRLRVITPDIGGLLPVYVVDRYAGFEVKTAPDLAPEEAERHIALTADAVARVAAQGVDRLLANHALFGPSIARRALAGTGIPYDVKIHGSAIEYVLVPHPRMMSYALDGLAAAERIVVGTRYVRRRMLDVFAEHRQALKLDDKLTIVPPGMDPDLFQPTSDRAESQRQLIHEVKARIALNPNGRPDDFQIPAPNGHDTAAYHQLLTERSDAYDQRAVDPGLPARWPTLVDGEPTLLYFGKFLAAKGIGELVTLIPELLEREPRLRFIFVGFGSYREHLEGMLEAFATGDRDLALACAAAGGFVDEFDPAPRLRQLTPREAGRITVTGILDHGALQHLLPLADIVVVPSKLAEAFGMVAVEAMAAGVLPICNAHSGLRDVIDELCAALPDMHELAPTDRRTFFAELPERIFAALEHLYPDGYGDRTRRDRIGRKLRRFAVDHFAWEGIARQLIRVD